MRIDDTVTVTCTDNDKTMPGTIVRMRRDHIDVQVGELLISFRQRKPGIFVGSLHGMEFVVKSAA
jgi:hypothetical protein